jgi:hypothetical protein
VHRIPFALNGIGDNAAVAVQRDISTSVVHGDDEISRVFIAVLDDRNDVGQW